MSVAFDLVKHLSLEAHPEGGYYRRTYQSNNRIQINEQDRFCTTLIYYLLKDNEKSKFHRLKSDEIWVFQMGSGIRIHHLYPDGTYEVKALGSNMDKGQLLQIIVPAGVWFAAEVIEPNSYCLSSCVVSPGFDFQDFEMASYKALVSKFPVHENVIKQFT